MDHDPAHMRRMRDTALDQPESRAMYPEAVAIGLVWFASMAGGIQALFHLFG